jgi:hypothetical protein
VTPCSADADCNDSTTNYCSGKTVNGQPTYCVPDTIKGLGLSHFDVTFPELGGVGSCLSTSTQVSGSCSASGGASVGAFGTGDGSCFEGTSSVAKCDGTSLPPGGCITMTLNIAGESTDLGKGLAVVVDKEGPNCQGSCLAGPSCQACDLPDDGGACLTRTRGFWGTHPHIAADFDPVTVCGVVVDGQNAGTCSTSEALCSNANDLKANPPYLQLVAQLTAAKLNLNATGALAPGSSCSDWTYGGSSIQTWLETCETNYCGGTKQQISQSQCIEALTAFNESLDTGFDVTPAPFDRPGPADTTQCQAASGNNKRVRLGGGGLSCQAP